MKEWWKWFAIVFLALTTAHFYAQYRLADQAASSLTVLVQQQAEFINNQCVTLLGRQGFQVTKTPPPVEEQEEVEEGK